ncbi:phage head closure protein [Paludisphaera rhizosphaerae]|uniref:phage head closure protein n=1 Tax=Paludisphaera rhizosphaerae TaxID=2711216 RepID=UPI0013ECE146|nr:phage head closure protein [Paludisphaera rhizosphaerae]
MIDPGQMRTKLRYQTVADSIDADGGKIETWSDAFAVWARVRPVKGDEVVRNDQVVAGIRYEIVCRYRDGIDPTGRFVVDISGRVLNIEGVVDWEMRRQELTIAAVERFGAVA